MNRVLFLSVVFIISSFGKVSGAVAVLQGIYQGKNLFVQNTMTKNMSSFSTKAVFVNDKKILEKPNTTSYEINLSYLQLNTPVVIKIVYIDGCKAPRVLNKQVIKPADKITFLSFNMDEDNISWVTRGESKNGVFYVQQFMHHKWSSLLKVKGKHSLSSNNYIIPSQHHHGLNQYRIKYIDVDGEVTYSSVEQFRSSRSPVTFYPKSVIGKTLTFVSNRPIYYEIYDEKGALIKKGKHKEVDCSFLKSEKVYSIIFDNQRKTFLKK